jgi:hypothetical protein
LRFETRGVQGVTEGQVEGLASGCLQQLCGMMVTEKMSRYGDRLVGEGLQILANRSGSVETLGS